MNLYDIPLFGMLRVKMDWLSARQETLAENIANASTQNYKAKDIKPLDFEDLLKRAKGLAAQTDVPQGQIAVTLGPKGYDPLDLRDGEMTPNGNSVVLEEQMMKQSETQVQFQTALDIYQKGLQMLRTAIGK
ncbi:MAG TPA: flagellar basal body protein [Alphaproteobacteria bacterium]|nr:flagellar basal body protein [Alphaproteobacteria bacterium]